MEEKPSKPFGWEVDVLTCEFMVKVEQNSQKVTKRYRGTRGNACSRAMMILHAWKVTDVRPLTEEEWRRTYGNPEEKGL